MTPILIYCFDAYCGWCYGFSPVMQKIEEKYKNVLSFEVLSGGMIMPENPVHIKASAGYIANAYKNVEDLSGVKFGSDFLWHIFNPEESDWYPHSEIPAIALCIFKEYYPEKAITFAHEIQYALHMEGRDLTDKEAYRHLLEKYSIHPEAFYEKLASDHYKEQAHYEFACVKQLQVDGYPAVLLQTDDLKFHLLAKGYTDFETLASRLDAVLEVTKK
ncbi:MAG: hypothetical protein RL582_240 [Bacteroidota bacterium]